MARQNLSFREAESMENNPSYNKVVSNNRFQLLNTIDNFPSLPTPSTSYFAPINKPKIIKNVNRVSASGENSRGKNSVKKRKAARSPSPGLPSSSPSHPLALPNPYARDFKECKSKIVETVVSFCENFVSRSQGGDVSQNENIKESLSYLIREIERVVGRSFSSNDRESFDSDDGAENDENSVTSY